MSRTRKRRDRRPPHWCELCKGTGWIETQEQTPALPGPDGTPSSPRPIFRVCPKVEARLVKPPPTLKPPVDRLRLAAGEREEDIA